MMVSYFLPNMRGLVAHELHGRGEGQRKIANLLGVTQARISHYLEKKKSGYEAELSKRFNLGEEELRNYSKILSDDLERSQIDGTFTLYSIWKNLLFSGNVCALHQEESSIPPDCSICMELHKPSIDLSEAKDRASEDALILRDLSKAISIVENSASFPLLMPQVSVNIAMSKEDPKSSRDVAAVPGRISRIHGRAKALVLPEFGSSHHMSSVLLIFNAKSKNIRAVMNLKHDQSIERALSMVHAQTFFTAPPRVQLSNVDQRPGKSEKDVLVRLVRVNIPSSSFDELPFAVIDRGSEGLEPITYLVGKTASSLAELSLKISHSYSNFQRD